MTYACPFCGFRQPFELSRLRGEDFPVENLRGTFAGLSWDTNEKTKPDGAWNFDAVGKTAHHRCHQCDGRIEDRPTVRRQLSESYSYLVTNPGAPAGDVGFQWPAEASTRIPFSESVVKYLRAKIAIEQLSYRLPLQEFYQKNRGISWSDEITDDYRIVAHEPYDVKSDWAEEAYRVLIVDCQRDLKRFWFSAYAMAMSGEVRELARGGADSFDEVEKIQGDWKIKDQHVFLDCGYEMTKVLRECVRHGHVGTIKVGKIPKKVWFSWTGLKGSSSEVFQHRNPRTKLAEWRIYSELKFYNTSVGTSERLPRALWFEWSNLHCKDLLRARREGEPGLPKFRTLPDTFPTTDVQSYFAQMRSEKRIEKYEGGKKRAIWVPIKENRANHFWDIGAMLMAVMARFGIIGGREEGGSHSEPPF